MEYELTIIYKLSHDKEYYFHTEDGYYILAEDEMSLETQICECVGRLFLRCKNDIEIEEIRVNGEIWNYGR